MNDVQFEQLLSFRPKSAGTPNLHEAQPCLRDMVFDYYCGMYKDTDKAAAATKAYLDTIYAKFVADVGDFDLWVLDMDRKDPNFEESQAKRTAIFNKIKPKGNWKDPINCTINADDFEECNKAAIHFTGGPLRIVRKTSPHRIQVRGAGYYANIGE